MPRKPRVVLATLVVASLLGVSLTWTGTDTSPVSPVASWVAIVSLGTVLTNGLLWYWYTCMAGRRLPWLVRRWSQVGHVAGVAALASLVVRLATAADVGTAAVSLALGGLTGTVALGVTVAVNRRTVPPEISRPFVLVIAVSAGLGLVAIACADVGMNGGSFGAVAVRALHLVAVGAWIGGAVWHNAVVVPAVRSDRQTGVRPVVQRFRRLVPLFVAVVLLTGLYQASTWLGTTLAPYLSTQVGVTVVVKLVALGALVALVAHGRYQQRRSRGADH
ncbi:CopD family protein [Haloarcula halophila]|uniref:CopD family protein n=1 Tax=Haloarcula TaxID=2237 RepID=UPI0023E38530|nr:CopD family protein [Halomicroarcula sp. DFY41]